MIICWGKNRGKKSNAFNYHASHQKKPSNFEAGEILATSDLTSHTVPGYDLYIYVNDGKTLVGPRTLTVIISGSKH